MRSVPSIVAFVVSLACAIACYVASDRAPLGTMIGAILFATLIVPPLSKHRSRTESALASAACVFAFVIVWLITIPMGIALPAALVLGSFALMLVMLTRLVHAAIVTLLAIAWLTWPVWFSESPHARFWIEAHPIFAINSLSPSLGVWTQQPVMYRLTALGQDVPYNLPTTIAWCVMFNLAIGALALIARMSLDRRRRRASVSDEPSDR